MKLICLIVFTLCIFYDSRVLVRTLPADSDGCDWFWSRLGPYDTLVVVPQVIIRSVHGVTKGRGSFSVSGLELLMKVQPISSPLEIQCVQIYKHIICKQNNWWPIKIGHKTAMPTIHNVALYVIFGHDLKTVAIST